MAPISMAAAQAALGFGESANTATIEKSASMKGDVDPSNEIKKKSDPGSPSGVWEYFFSKSDQPEEETERYAGSDEECDEENEAEAESVFTHSTGFQSVMSQKNLAPIPERLVDFFGVVGHELGPIRDFAETPSDVRLQPKLVDCYPERRQDLDFPQELPMFCMPNDCQLSTKKEDPSLSTFVLTSSNGHRMYGSALIYYEIVPLEDLCEAFWQGESLLPSWIEQPQPYFLPKCLVVVSHHAFYDVQRTFLSQLYRISTSGRSPLPLERYIANFVHDVPLPRAGAAEISWKCFTDDVQVDFRRPAVNELPLVNFSYRPLFRTLSISNILALWGTLLQEGRVVLRSENLSLLTPIAEALMSLLFPLTWQGLYVPVLPTSMVDVLDAPVPFLVGFVGNSCPQPEGVIVCDLDQDILHLGTDDYHNPATLPPLPKVHISKLRHALEDAADSLYLVPPCGMKGRTTTAVLGLLENPMRESYSIMVQVRDVSLTNTHRQDILAMANSPPTRKDLEDSDFVLYGEEETKYKSQDSETKPNNRPTGKGAFMRSLRRQGRVLQARSDRAFSFTPTGAAQYDIEMVLKKDRVARELYEVDEEFANSIRYPFLRFFTTLLMRYKEFSQNGDFDYASFSESLADMNYGSKVYVETVVKTQMFERFLVESSTRRKLFDEHILLQANTSILSKKTETPFLDEQLAVTKIVLPAAPCAAGVRRDIVFEYHGFPSLNVSEMVANKNLDPVSALCYLGGDIMCSAVDW